MPRVLASDLEVREEPRDENEVERPVAGDLVGDVDLTATRIPDRGAHRAQDRTSAAAGPSGSARRGRGSRGRNPLPRIPALRKSGCPDSNWGPLRPERSALPGCATPRAGQGSRSRNPSSALGAVDSARMAPRDGIVGYANELLEIERFPEFAPQGLQVVGAAEVTTIACGVSCSRELFEQAAELGAELVLVHHGLFWRNEPLVVDARLRGRLEALFRGDASLVAYHLALDAHPTLGNNAQLAARIGAMPDRPVRRRRARMHGRARLGRRPRRARRRGRGSRTARPAGRRPGDPTPRRLDRRRRPRPRPGGARGLRRAPHRRAGGAERRDRPRARDPPDRRGAPRDGAVRRAGARRPPRRALRPRRGTTSRSRTPFDAVAVRPLRRVSSEHMDVFGRRAR